MKVVITGGFGFLGWHTAARLRALHGVDAVRLGREQFADPSVLSAEIGDADAVLHVAGVNRAESDEAVEAGNVELAQTLATAIRAACQPVDVVYANSVQAALDNPYGRGKASGAGILAEVVREVGGNFADLLLPNLFGEHGRPAYNSFVATFAHQIAAGRTPIVQDDREIDLLHAQDAAAALLAAIGTDETRIVRGEPHRISEVRELLLQTHDLYAERGEIPPLTSSFETNLFNTYRAASFPAMWPITPPVFDDQRGVLFETVRSHGGPGQAFASTTQPGQTRGDHYHLHKVERFFVVRGRAEIRLRRLLRDEVVTFILDGDRPSFVDMPTLWVHSIRNVGDTELVTMFWADQLLDREKPDQFAERVSA